MAPRALCRAPIPAAGCSQASYNAGNRITGLTAGNVQVAFDFSGIQRDSLNRLVNYTDSFGNQIAYTYDAAGQLTSMTLPGGNTVTYQYDHAHRLSKVSDWLGNFALYRYDAAGWPLSVTVSGGPVDRLSVRRRAQSARHRQHRAGWLPGSGLPVHT